MFVKFHHAIGDGVSLQYYISHCSDPNFRPNILQRFVTPSIWRDILLWILFPILFVYALIKLSCSKSTENVLSHRNRSLAGVKAVGISQTFQISDLKQVGKHFNATINDLILTVFLSCLKEFLLKEYGNSSEEFPLGIPFNLKELPKGNHVNCRNEFAIFFFQFPLVNIANIEKDTWEALGQVNARTNDLKKTILPYAFKLLNYVNSIFPHTLQRNIMLATADKFPIVFTNVAGSKSPIYFNGKCVYDILYLAPSVGKNCINVCVSSYKERLHVISNSDISRMEKPYELINMVSEKLNEYVIRYAGKPLLQQIQTFAS